MELIQRSDVEVAGKNVVVLGRCGSRKLQQQPWHLVVWLLRSNIVGMPVSQILQSMDATVTVCHSRTKDMVSYLRNADIVTGLKGPWDPA